MVLPGSVPHTSIRFCEIRTSKWFSGPPGTDLATVAVAVNAGSEYEPFLVMKTKPTPVDPPGPAVPPSMAKPTELTALGGQHSVTRLRIPGTGLSVITNSGHAP